MALRSDLRASGGRWGAVAGLVVASLVTGILVVAAYQHAQPAAPGGTAAPVPTFTLGVQTPTPEPTATPAPVIPAASERFLVAGAAAGVWWRGVAGDCADAAPVLERSADGGATWTTVTPADLGPAKLVAVLATDQTEAVIVVGTGDACEAQGLRTFTQGSFWEPFADAIATEGFAAPATPATVQLRGAAVPAPCTDPRSIRAAGDVAALICDGTPYAAAADQSWSPLPVADAAALAIDGTDVVVAHGAEGCAGLALTRVSSTDPAQPSTTTCLDGTDAAAPVALTATESGLLVWSGDAVLTAAR